MLARTVNVFLCSEGPAPAKLGLCVEGESCTDCLPTDPGFPNECATETWCGDGVDNDCDGLIDCADNSAIECPTELSCSNGVDDDCDGLIDCFDLAECPPGTPPCP